jgi:alpha-mannosidase
VAGPAVVELEFGGLKPTDGLVDDADWRKRICRPVPVSPSSRTRRCRRGASRLARMLKLRTPTALRGAAGTYEVPYSTIVRPMDGAEEPGQRWVDVTGAIDGADGAFGVAVLNDSKYGFDVLDGSIGVTGVRSPIYAHHDPAVPKPGIRYQYQDIGFQRFTLAILPHAGAWEDAGVPRRAVELNVRPTTLTESPHRGDLPPAMSFAAVDSPDVVLGALKRAEDGEDLVLRLVESHGRGGRVRGRLGDAEFEVEIGAWQVRSWRLPADGGGPIEVNLLEEAVSASAVEHAAEADGQTNRGAGPPIAEPDRPEPDPPAVEPLGV